jgi:hypothetical protein
VALSTGFLTKSTTIDQLFAGFQQVSDAFELPVGLIRHWEFNRFGHVHARGSFINGPGLEKVCRNVQPVHVLLIRIFEPISHVDRSTLQHELLQCRP